MPPIGKIASLPPEHREWLHRAFVERAFGDIEGITEEFNALMKEAGIAITIGKSAIGAESQKVKRAQESIKAATEACRLMHEAAPDDAAMRSRGVMAMIEEGLFSAFIDLREAEVEEDPASRIALMTKASQGVAKLAAARVIQAKWQSDLDAKLKAAADRATKLAKKGGASTKTVEEIRAAILGVKKPAASTQGGAQ
jgi:Protein of unknown function (DUF3486)